MKLYHFSLFHFAIIPIYESQVNVLFVINTVCQEPGSIYANLKFFGVQTEWLQLGGITHGSALGPQQQTQQQTTMEDTKRASDILDATIHELKLDKSNILLLGPTGSGNYF